jgi:hypothetical protein
MTQRLDYTNVAPDGVKALAGVYGYIGQTSLPHPLVIWFICASRRSTVARIALTCTLAS